MLMCYQKASEIREVLLINQGYFQNSLTSVFNDWHLVCFSSDSLSQGLQTSNALTGNNYSLGLQNNSLGFGNSTLGTIGSPAIGNLSGGKLMTTFIKADISSTLITLWLLPHLAQLGSVKLVYTELPSTLLYSFSKLLL